MADGNLGQDDIDKMLSELGADGAKPAASPPPSSPAAPAAGAGGNLGQDDIDKMLNALGADGAPAPAPSAPPAPQPVAAAPPPAKPAQGEALDQDAIDALIAQAAEAVSTDPKPATAAVSTGGGGHLDQNEIDKLLADLDPQSRKVSATSGAGTPTHLDQKDIDRLLNELEVTTGGSGSEVVPATAKAPGSKSKAPAATAATETALPSSASKASPTVGKGQTTAEGPLSQDDIDRLLSELGAPSSSLGAEKKKEAASAEAPRQSRTIPPAPAPVQGAPGKATDATQALSADEIDAIVAKQGAAAPPGSDSEAVIAQSDIDALVKQLAQATGSPEAEEVAEAIAGKAADIDRIQAEAAAPTGPELTRDAVDVNSVLGRTASTASLHAQPVAVVSVPTVGVGEWRWGQRLLAAAVLFLCVCSGALILLTLRVADLSTELRAARQIEHPVEDGVADRLRLALAKLAESDEAESARGVRWMEELKRKHPERAADIGIALARHFRRREAWRRAADEYGAALESAGGSDDPQVTLEHADCLTRLGDDAGAIRQVYALLAAEARWTAERDAEGRPVPGLERNRQAIADAYLMLGRLLARDGSAAPVAAETSSGHTPAAAHAPAAASGGHH